MKKLRRRQVHYLPPLKLIVIILIVMTVSCNNTERQLTSERRIMMDIFPAMIDSIYVETTFTKLPPPIEIITDTVTGKQVTRPVMATDRLRQHTMEQLRQRKASGVVTTIIIDDTIQPVHAADLEGLPIAFTDTSNNKPYHLEWNNSMQPKGIRLIPSSRYKAINRQDVHILNKLSFSRILLNKERDKGVLACTYSCGGLCGNGYRVYIKKSGNRWIIERIEHAWVA